MIKQTLVYSLKVWLTSVVLGPLLYAVYDALTRRNFIHSFQVEVAVYLYSLGYGLVLSIPSWMLFWLSLHSINMLQLVWEATKGKETIKVLYYFFWASFKKKSVIL
jgi:hypothetical protein